MTIDIEKLAQDMFGTVLVNGKEYYEIDSEEWKNLAEAYAAKVHDKRVEELEVKNRELSASLNDLREALELAEKALAYDVELVTEALSKTPAQSLQAFENEMIEKCAKVVDESYAFDSDGFSKAIRALKKSS